MENLQILEKNDNIENNIFTKKLKFSSQLIEIKEGIIYGLALPFNSDNLNGYPKFTKDKLKNINIELPIFFNHNPEYIIGKAYELLVKEDGVYFVGRIFEEYIDILNSLEYQGISIGGEYTVNQGNEVKSLVIYEISLTANPAYTDTFFKVLASKNSNKENFLNFKNNIMEDVIMEELKSKIKAQEEEMAILIEKIDQLTNTINSLDERLTTLEQTVSQLAEQMTAVSEVEAKVLDQVKEAVTASVNAVKQSVEGDLLKVFDALKPLLINKK